jgi:endonuclease/exonuclease/phosphatase family metal-dependent hydrolase
VTRLRLVTYNIRKGKGASGRSTDGVGELGRALSDFSPDLVLCQEVFHGHTPPSSQSEELAALLGLACTYEPNKLRRVGHHGNATFSRHPIEHAQNYDISTNRLERRGALYTRLLLDGQPLHIINAHLGLNHWQRTEQVRRIADILRRVVAADEAVLLAGDFNDWSGRLDGVIVDELGFQNAFGHLPTEAVATWHARRPVLNLDRVYLRHLRAVHARRLVGEPWHELSDHLPLLVEVESKQAAERRLRASA